MPSSTTYDPGTIVLVAITFTDGSAESKRPAVVISVPEYHASRSDAIVVPLTTQTTTAYFGDCDVLEWQMAGLPRPSRSKGVIQTIKRSGIEKRFGVLTAGDLQRLMDSMKLVLGIA